MARDRSDDQYFAPLAELALKPESELFLGLGRCLDAMLTWCRENMEAREWAQHGHTEHQPPELPTHVARFYFAEAGMAEAFRQS